ncbi:MAG: hypothetical protein IPI77_18370 [Saprospiraceae bacterium]|nr:hypothetical protein [Saprospiraceae bacterium]
MKELSFISDITVIANGFHNISTRFKDANGKWSHTNSRSFYKESFTSSMPLSNIIQLEYFVDTDPGFGSGSSVSLTPAIDIPSLAFTIDMTKVSIGNHKIYVRALDANGKWSLVSTGSFVVEPPEDVYITIGDIAGNACASSPIVIPFKVNIPYGSNNIFTAQLSDGNGNFANPIIIGSLTGSTSDTINALIPANTPIGNGYRVRILASSPLDTSTESSTSFIIQRAPEQPFSINGKTQVCVGTEFYTASNVESGAKFEWVLSSGGTIDTSGINAKVNWNLQGTHLLSFTTSNTCGIGRTQILSISVFNAPPSLIPTIIISNGRDLSVDNSNSTNISGYAWYFNDTLISEALYSSYFAIKDGVYKVRYSNPCGIGPASDSLVITTLQNQFIFLILYLIKYLVIHPSLFMRLLHQVYQSLIDLKMGLQL